MAEGDRWLTLPKVNLHHHLEGAVRLETFLEYAVAYKLPIPVRTLPEAAAYLQVSDQDQSLADFLVKVDRSLEISKYPGVLERMAFEAVEDSYRQNVHYLEIRFGPWLHVTEARPLEGVIEEVLQGMARACRLYPIIARLIVCALRQHAPEKNLALVTAAAKYRDHGVVGFDIAGDEAAYPADIFVEAFKLAKAAGLGITVHAGEVGEGSRVLEAIKLLGADRIGHGIQIADHPALVEQVKAAGVTLEVCPTSNVHTRSVPNLASHPIRRLFDQGVRISLGDDDPTTSGITISSEYQLLRERFAFTPAEIAQVVLAGAQAAFLPQDQKEHLAAELRQKLDSWLQSEA